jgi:hypothetical protein
MKVLMHALAASCEELCARTGKPPLYIINFAIRSRTMPNDWKCARVTPIHKVGSKMNPNNYRPIPVLSRIAKIFEKVIFDQMYEYLTTQ